MPVARVSRRNSPSPLGVAQHVVSRAVETIPFGIGLHRPAQDDAVAIGATHGFNIDVEILYGVFDAVPGESAHGIGARQQIVIIGFLHDGVADSHAQGDAPWDSRCPREHTRHAHGGSQKAKQGPSYYYIAVSSSLYVYLDVYTLYLLPPLPAFPPEFEPFTTKLLPPV